MKRTPEQPRRKKFQVRGSTPTTSPERRRFEFSVSVNAPPDMTFEEAREVLVRVAIELTSERLNQHAHDLVMHAWKAELKIPPAPPAVPSLQIVARKPPGKEGTRKKTP
jgi:hypothetical protein